MSKSNFNFIDYLENKAYTEEDVKYAYIKEFDIPFSTRYKNDCRTINILFEFKKDRNFKNEKDFAKTLAQSLYYVYRTKYGIVDDSIPSYIVLADINEASIIETEGMKDIYSNTSFDWERAPSSPDPNIINEIIKKEYYKKVHIYNIQEQPEYMSFKEKLESLLTDIDSIIDKKIVSDKNFEDVFVHWNDIIGKSIDKEEKAIYFIKDLQLSTFYDNSRGMMIFKFDNAIEEYPIPFKDYNHFWELYKRPPTARDMESIISKADRLNNMDKRRFEGQFYTPLRFAKLSLDYIEEELGEDWYKEYKIWDMACYDDKTEVLTKEGFKLFKNLKDDDLIYSLNPETEEAEYIHFVQRQVIPFKGKLDVYKGKRFNLKVTPDHSMYVKSRMRADKPNFREFKLQKSSELVEFLQRGNVVSQVACAPLKEEKYISPSFFTENTKAAYEKLIGFYIGDGCVFKNSKKIINAIRFHMRKQRKIKYLRGILDELTISYDYYEQDGYSTFRITDKLILNYLIEECGVGFNNKRIPRNLMFSDKEGIRNILNGLKNSDGSVREYGWVYTTANKELSEQIEILGIHAGEVCHTLHRERIYKGKEVESWETYFGIHKDKTLNKSMVFKEDYLGNVYDITLEKYHIMLVRRNGYSCFSGNCGTGNLEYYIPTYENVYMSTIDDDEVKHITDNNLFPGATIFQYDYLNDDVELVMSGADLLDDSLGWKLPRALREDLTNPENKWVVLINPPFGRPTNQGSKHKSGITNNDIENEIKESDNKNIKELYYQFLFRIGIEIPNVFLATYSTYAILKDLKGFNYKTGQEFKPFYLNGFIFDSKVFSGTKGGWPIAFTLWNYTDRIVDGREVTSIEIIDLNADKIGEKILSNSNKHLNKWVKRPRNTEPAVPLKNALVIANKNKTRSEKKAKNFIGYILNGGNDVQNAGMTSLYSSMQSNNNGWNIISDNFDKSITVYTVKNIVKDVWYNHNDQFKQPSNELSQEFIDDCLAYTLFNGSNQTSSLKDIEYDGKIYQIENNFFPFLVDEVREWDIENVSLYSQLRIASDTFVAKKLNNIELSEEAQKVFDKGRELYRLYYKEYNNLDRTKYKLDNWDVGWYQIRMSLKDKLGKDVFNEFKEAYNVLADKLRPQVYEYGFLDKEIIYDGDDL